MALPLDSDNPPMEARPVHDLPEGEQWRYEPKWDGFRCLAFRDGETVELRSKSGQPLGRYFPDVAVAIAAVVARQFVLDGEIIIPVGRRLSFEALQLRPHPAASRVRSYQRRPLPPRHDIAAPAPGQGAPAMRLRPAARPARRRPRPARGQPRRSARRAQAPRQLDRELAKSLPRAAGSS
jgi:hypothetical protein